MSNVSVIGVLPDMTGYLTRNGEGWILNLFDKKTEKVVATVHAKMAFIEILCRDLGIEFNKAH